MTESIVERLAKTSPGLEVWWDSSPLVFENWAKKLLSEVPAEQRADLEEQVNRLYDPTHPENTLFRGVTTNPPLSYNAMKDNPARWQAWIKDYRAQNPQADLHTVYWALYKEIVRLGAEALAPVYEQSGYRFGHISGQVDPRDAFDGEKMLAQALELRAIAPNVMIKIPTTCEGVKVLGELTGRGIPTNSTLGFVVPQFKAVAEAVQEGLLKARANGVDLSGWRSVVTQMSVRWENAATFDREAEAAGVTLTPEMKRWASISIFKKANALFRKKAYPSKMLFCSLRLGPVVNGEERVWHLEHTAGADAVFTLPPSYIGELLTHVNDIPLESRINEPIPAEVEAELMKIEYYRRAVAEDGYTPEEFNSLEPLRNTYNEFCGATEKMVDFVRQNM